MKPSLSKIGKSLEQYHDRQAEFGVQSIGGGENQASMTADGEIGAAPMLKQNGTQRSMLMEYALRLCVRGRCKMQMIQGPLFMENRQDRNSFSLQGCNEL